MYIFEQLNIYTHYTHISQGPGGFGDRAASSHDNHIIPKIDILKHQHKYYVCPMYITSILTMLFVAIISQFASMFLRFHFVENV